MGKYIPYDGRKLGRIVKEERRKGNIIVLTGGFFDYFHAGHAELFKKCKKLGDITIVNVVNDKRAKIFRTGDRKLDYREGTRVRLPTLIEIIDYVTIYPKPVKEFNPTLGLARILKPDIIVQNEDVWAKYDFNDFKTYFDSSKKKKIQVLVGTFLRKKKRKKIKKRKKNQIRVKWKL